MHIPIHTFYIVIELKKLRKLLPSANCRQDLAREMFLKQNVLFNAFLRKCECECELIDIIYSGAKKLSYTPLGTFD